MKKMISIVMTAMLIAIPVTPAFALTNNETVKEKAQELASKLLSDYGVSGIQYAIRLLGQNSVGKTIIMKMIINL
ncbi:MULTISPECIES: hypothetical protein [unclassified Peribacillus]|uniref:hypothetical protein n=1 Tax=unclassified Peribacillus TaxID=2675266 RepID=UPI00367222C3